MSSGISLSVDVERLPQSRSRDTTKREFYRSRMCGQFNRSQSEADMFPIVAWLLRFFNGVGIDPHGG